MRLLPGPFDMTCFTRITRELHDVIYGTFGHNYDKFVGK